MRKRKRRINVQISFLEDLTQVALDVLSEDGTPLSGQDILDAVSETILLKYNNYDLESEPELDS